MCPHARRYFFLNAGILVLGTIAYVFIARGYTHKPIVGAGGGGASASSKKAAAAAAGGGGAEAGFEQALDDFKAA
jgi:hypothetical protein